MYISDILETNIDDKYYMNATQIAWVQRSSYRDRQPYHISQKCGTLKVWWDIKRIFTNAISNSITLRSMEHWEDRTVRYLTPVEYERLQTVSDNYTEGVSNMQRYKMLGNWWTVDVIAHIFSFLL